MASGGEGLDHTLSEAHAQGRAKVDPSPPPIAIMPGGPMPGMKLLPFGNTPGGIGSPGIPGSPGMPGIPGGPLGIRGPGKD